MFLIVDLEISKFLIRSKLSGFCRSVQSTHRYKMLQMRGQPTGAERLIDDEGRLNRTDSNENRFKTESRVVHNGKLIFLIF